MSPERKEKNPMERLIEVEIQPLIENIEMATGEDRDEAQELIERAQSVTLEAEKYKDEDPIIGELLETLSAAVKQLNEKVKGAYGNVDEAA